MSANNSALSTGPQEPVLDMLDIQGAVVPGFFKPHQTLLGLRIPDGGEIIHAFKQLLRKLVISNAQQTLEDRRHHRARRRETGDRHPEPDSETALLGLGFSYPGLRRLTPGTEAIPSEAFKLGLVARSSLLGDPTDAHKEGHPSRWLVGAPHAELDVLLLVAGDDRPSVTRKAEQLARLIQESGIDIPYKEDGDIREKPYEGHEHFGFDDGVSQPGIRGRASSVPDDFITERHLDSSQIPAYWLYGYPGQDLIWPGELVIGYPSTSPDPLLPGPALNPSPAWTRNGSFLVFRRLRQDVGLFWRTMKQKAAELSQLPGFSLSDEELAAKLVGRWMSGAPVNRVPGADDPTLGADLCANNDFRLDSDTPSLKTTCTPKKNYPPAKADPAGITCPWAAHIRKVNTRDSASDMGASDSRYNRRLLRVGVPFGKSVKDRYADENADPEHGNRGLLFLSIQSSIEQQFEFLMARWINDPARPKMPGGHDMLIGQNAAAEDGIRRCSIFGSGLQQAQIATDQQWVIPTGGGYFFMPSISALRDVISQ
jgi:Dyp-type peroxidase family